MPFYHLHIVPPLERNPGFFRGLVYFLMHFLHHCDAVECHYPSHYSLHVFREKIGGQDIQFCPAVDNSSSIPSRRDDGRAVLFVTISNHVRALPTEGLTDPISGDPVMIVGLTPYYWEIMRAKNLIALGALNGFHAAKILPVLCEEGYPGCLSTALVEETLGRKIFSVPFLTPSSRRLSENTKDIPDVMENSLKNILETMVKNLWELLRHREATNPENERSAHLMEGLTHRVIARVWDSVRVGGFQGPGSSQALMEKITEEISRLVRSTPEWQPGPTELEDLKNRVLSHVTGLGPLENLIKNPQVSEIMVNGLSDIYLEAGGRIEPSPVKFVNETELKAVIDRIAAEGGRRVDVSSPFCDVRLKDGSRANVILPPLSLAGPVLTIRRFKSSFLNFQDLIGCGALTFSQAEQLRKAVEERLNIVVAGNTGSGKTTLLNILSSCIFNDERILTLEDTAELSLQKPHVVRLQTRPPNAEGKGEVKMADLVVNALRMRPDRLIVGECRGAEAIPMLQAMNTGHDGSMTTLHSNSAADAIRRLESMVLLGAPEWPIQVVREQILSALDLVIYLRREGSRRQLVEMIRIREENGLSALVPVESA